MIFYTPAQIKDSVLIWVLLNVRTGKQMRPLLLIPFSIFSLVFICNAKAETLIEREKNLHLSDVDVVSIFRSEVRWCENKSPDFKKQADSLIAKFENNPRYKEISRHPDFSKLKPEADAYVLDRRKSSDVKHTCDKELIKLKNAKF